MPGYLLVILLVQRFYRSVSWLTKANYSQITCSIEHIVVVGSPFITIDYVLLRLVAFELFITCINSIVILKSFGALRFVIFYDDKPATMIVFKLDWETWLQLIFFFGTWITKYFNRALETYESWFISAGKVEEWLGAFSV